jgi:hypothetical protein
MKIQWTTRLRDFLSEEKYWISTSEKKELAGLREVELVVTDDSLEPPRSNAAARKKGGRHEKVLVDPILGIYAIPPPPPTNPFEEFDQCYKNCLGDRCMTIYDAQGGQQNPRGPRCAIQVTKRPKPSPLSVEEMRQRHGYFDVLWLSETIFVTSYALYLTLDADEADETRAKVCKDLFDYQITLISRDSERNVIFNVYSVNSFEAKRKERSTDRVETTPVSELPMEFVTDLVRDLPNNHWAAINLQWGKHALVPPERCVDFLAVIPRRPADRTTTHRLLTLVQFENPLSEPQLGAVLSAHDLLVNPHMRLEFIWYTGTLANPDDSYRTCPSFRRLNRALRTCPSLRHVKVPTMFTYHEWGDDEELFTDNVNLESLSVEKSVRGDTKAIFAGISKNPHLKSLYVWYHDSDYESEGWLGHYSKFLLFLSTTIAQHPSLREVVFSFQIKMQDFQLFPFAAARLVGTVASSCLDEFKYNTSLCHLSLSAESIYKELPSSGFYTTAKNSDWWDRNMAPRLVVNWHSHNVQKLAGDHGASFNSAGAQNGLLSLLVQAVNRGAMYRKTTTNRPHNRSTANASVIFVMIHQKYQASKHDLIPWEPRLFPYMETRTTDAG